MENHEEGEIPVTEEIADKMVLKSTEISNVESTADVFEFMEKLIILDNDPFWDYIPGLLQF